jgi:phosphoglucosamine mutase
MRGQVGTYPMTDEMIFKLGYAAGIALREQRERSNLRIMIGKDTRESCDKIEQLLCRGMLVGGATPVIAGVIPTPALAYLTKEFGMDTGAMISASHNLFMDNGVKFFSSDGYKISESQEGTIENILFNLPGVSCDTKPDKSNAIEHRTGASAVYIEFLGKIAGGMDLKGMKIVIDCANGATSGIARTLFEQLGADAIVINANPDGRNINSDCGSLYPGGMAQTVRKYGADIGFSYDGDGDRVIMADENGDIRDGDYIMAISALELQKEGRLRNNTVVGTVMTNFGMEMALARARISLIRTSVGDKYILERMLSEGFCFGGEQSGHIIFLDKSVAGDGLITSLVILQIMKKYGRGLAALSECMQKVPQVLVNVRVKSRKPIQEIPEFTGAVNECKAKLDGKGRILVRYSGTEQLLRIMVEGENSDEVEKIANSLKNMVDW